MSLKCHGSDRKRNFKIKLNDDMKQKSKNPSFKSFRLITFKHTLYLKMVITYTHF